MPSKDFAQTLAGQSTRGVIYDKHRIEYVIPPGVAEEVVCDHKDIRALH